MVSWSEWIDYLARRSVGNDRYGEGMDSGEHPSWSILTMHAAKGLEFDTVIIPDLSEGTVPHIRSLKHPEEERRLLYVAMTRARRELILTYALSDRGQKRKPSRFLRELRGTASRVSVAKNR